MNYEWTDDMGEISGFGGYYEDCCRRMVQQGLAWWDAHPGADPVLHGYKGVFGFVVEDNADAKALTEAMCEGNDATGAMVQATLNTVFFVHQHGWTRYQEEMRKREAEAPPRAPS